MDVLLDGLIYTLQHHGGISRYTSALAENLRETGVSVEVAVVESILEKGLRTPYIRPAMYPFLSSWIAAEEKKYPQSLLTHVPYVIADYAIKNPLVITLHDLMYEMLPEFRGWLQKKIVYERRKMIARAQAVICISHATAASAQEFYTIPKEKIFVTPLGVGKTFFDFKNSLSAQEIPLILYVGNRSSAYKNFSTLVEACGKLDQNRNWELVCIGGGEFNKKEVEKIKELKLEKKMRAVSFVDEITLKTYYQNAALVVFPSLTEGFGLPVLEALATGTPLLLSDIPVFHEVAGEAAHYFTATIIDSLTSSLDYLLRNETLKNSKVQIGLERARDFSWANTARKTIAAYESAIQM